ncbi:MAG: tail fiber domain-containing protein [Chitinophagaceae bacterium]|nr:tail fiber domain-containing protein [Chitinophagaceae bacterium]
MKKLFTFIFALFTTLSQAQVTITQPTTGAPPPPFSSTATLADAAWYRGGNNPVPNTNNIFGTMWPSEVYHYTGGTLKFITTVNAALNNTNFNSTFVASGDGISVAPGAGSAPFATIDLFTGPSNTTFFRLGQASLLQTVNTRVEHIANFNGFWYNATGTGGGNVYTPQYVWNIQQTEKGRLGANGWWRFGNNFAVPVAANNIVEISTQGAPTAPYGVLGSGLRFRNLTSASNIIPNGSNGVNSTKVLTVDINGDVVLTNPNATVLANNGLQVTGGVVQLGGACGNVAQENNAQLQSSRKVKLNKRNLYFTEAVTQNGRIGIGDFPGCVNPGNLVEITKNNTTPSTIGLSGLQLGDLRTGAFVNPANGMALSVNPNGDVILVNASSSSGGVSLCNTAPINNVTKVTAVGTAICQTNITDLFPLGNVGINNTAPNDALDVNIGGGTAGNLDLNNPTSRYEINDSSILWHKGNSTNLYVGILAGDATGPGFGNGDSNTVVGYQAGSGLPFLGQKNVLLGSQAGFGMWTSYNNTYAGHQAGYNSLYVNNNTYLGAYAGYNNAPGADENVLIGYNAGYNMSGLHNVCIGNNSGFNNAGFQNTFVGLNSGTVNVGGAFNVSLGGGSGPGLPNLNNSIAIGNGSSVMNSNHMILGDNSINVGIGLSGLAAGPQNKLEIRTTTGSPYFGSVNGSSGLRFRNMTSANTPITTTFPGVLSVDANGDVILVNPPASSSSVTLCNTAPINNVVKVTAIGTALCETNITDMFPLGTVGINNTSPNDALDVNIGGGSAGNLDLNNTNSAYEINDTAMLLHKGNSTNLFVGSEAGALIPSGPGFGDNNTVIGKRAHSTQPMMGQNSTFVGYQAGMNASMLNNSTHIGAGAGQNNAIGADENTIVGWNAGFNNAGLHNVFIGNLSGFNNAGFQNTFVGIGSGQLNINGAHNVSIGGGSGPLTGNLNNSIAIGNAANTTTSNTMILGDNAVNVGVGLSGVASGPQNKMELNTTAGSPYFGSPNGSSGLRFRNMTSANTPLATAFNGVLSVDNNGDVILVQDKTGSSGGGVGSYCGTAPNPLTFHYRVPLNTFDYYFDGDGPMTDKVNIGYPCGSFPLKGKLNVTTAFQTDPTVGSQESYSIYATNTNNAMFSSNTGVYGEATATAPATDATGVWGKASSTRRTIGVWGQGGIALGTSYGGVFDALTPANLVNQALKVEAENGVNTNIGMTASATGGTVALGGTFDAFSVGPFVENIGLTGRAFPFSTSNTPTYPGGVHIGVYGQVPNSVPNISFDYAGYFDGRVYINGNAISPGYAITSDAKFKKNVQAFENGLDIIRQIKTKTYTYDVQNKFGIQFSDKKQYGVIAQEVEKVLPELIVETHKPEMKDATGKTVTEAVDYKAVNYDAFIPILIRSVQQLEEQNEKQDKLIRELSAKLEALSPTTKQHVTPSNLPTQTINLSDKSTIVLNQNVPNPFAEKTTISYHIPEGTGTAQIVFSTSEGRVIKTAEIRTRGAGELTIYAQDLSSGIYIYTLFVDGKVVDSKRMMKTN